MNLINRLLGRAVPVKWSVVGQGKNSVALAHSEDSATVIKLIWDHLDVAIHQALMRNPVPGLAVVHCSVEITPELQIATALATPRRNTARPEMSAPLAAFEVDRCFARVSHLRHDNAAADTLAEALTNCCKVHNNPIAVLSLVDELERWLAAHNTRLKHAVTFVRDFAAQNPALVKAPFTDCNPDNIMADRQGYPVWVDVF